MSQSQSSKTWKKDSSRPSLESARTVDIQLGHGVTRVVIDLWLLLVPMPFVLKIQMTRRKKFLTVMVFVFAYCAVVFTIGRTASIFIAGDTLNTDITWLRNQLVLVYLCNECAVHLHLFTKRVAPLQTGYNVRLLVALQ
ncbi:hypothetical protein PSPO01_03236 [Paraphaeosphaeria sporulosa]